MQEAPVEDSSQSIMEYRLKRFYRLWCLKESMIKALDVQSGFDLKTIEFTIQDEEETEKVQSTEHCIGLLPFFFVMRLRLHGVDTSNLAQLEVLLCCVQYIYGSVLGTHTHGNTLAQPFENG